jgi:NADP-dependent 3-hydroxy acid dehydrogenase YdfG
MEKARTAIVTGGSAGIGRAIACALSARGWQVAIGGRRPARLEEAVAAVAQAGGHAFGHVLDVSDPDSVDVFVSAAEKALGPVDLLVNNAAGAKPGALQQQSVAQIREALDGLVGALLMSRRVLADWVPAGRRGDLVFVSSRAAAMPWPRHVPYAAAKAGVEGAAASLRAELAGTGIRTLVLRIGDTISEFAAGWSPEQLAELGYWMERGLIVGSVLDPAQVAEALVAAVTAPPGVHLETLVVNPEAPRAKTEAG